MCRNPENKNKTKISTKLSWFSTKLLTWLKKNYYIVNGIKSTTFVLQCHKMIFKRGVCSEVGEPPVEREMTKWTVVKSCRGWMLRQEKNDDWRLIDIMIESAGYLIYAVVSQWDFETGFLTAGCPCNQPVPYTHHRASYLSVLHYSEFYDFVTSCHCKYVCTGIALYGKLVVITHYCLISDTNTVSYSYIMNFFAISLKLFSFFSDLEEVVDPTADQL